jgi:hypothetical protein
MAKIRVSAGEVKISITAPDTMEARDIGYELKSRELTSIPEDIYKNGDTPRDRIKVVFPNRYEPQKPKSE